MHALIGEHIGNFRVIKLLGKGGMSSVFLALDTSLDRQVALKIPHERFFQDEKFVSRFMREAKAMAKLKHNNIVHIYTVGVHEDVPFFAMEYVAGKTLSEVIADGPLSVDMALYYLKQIAAAIGRAHEMHVIHRDIKPDNILIEPSGHVRVTDFGVSKVLTDGGSQQTLALVGTPHYMSPEICLGENFDHRTDIYSLGVLFFEMLAGIPPFKGNTPVETMRKQVSEPPEFSPELKKKIPEKVQTIILKMLDKNPQRRHPNIRSLLRDLQRVQTTSGEQTLSLNPAEVAQAAGVRDIRDFISHLHGPRSKWPWIILALTILSVLVLAAAVLLEKDGAFDKGAVKGFLSRTKESVVLPPRDFTASANIESADPIFNPVQSADNQVPPPLFTEPEKKVEEAVPPFTTGISSKPPGAHVYIDSELRGETPLNLDDIPAGAHAVVLKLDGYQDYLAQVKLDAAKNADIFHEFTESEKIPPLPSSLQVDSEPSGASVYLDGKRQGKTPLKLPDVPVEEHVLKLELKDYEEVTKRIEIQPEENFRISFNLVKKPQFGDLAVNSTPEGAEIRLNGAYKGMTPSDLRRVPVGQYELVLRKEGYEQVTRQVTCKPNSLKSIEVSLKMLPFFEARQHAQSGDKAMKDGAYESAIASYDQARKLDPGESTYLEKQTRARRALFEKRMRGVLTAYERAYENEDIESLASLLDYGCEQFLDKEVSNATALFSAFDNITIEFSDVRIPAEETQEALLQLHLTIHANDTAGARRLLVNTDAKFTLRKKTEDSWKICAINQLQKP